ncbi:hypothetical protein NKJ81_11435 [Mesorhizobium sp. M0018]|uniref:hypothetical protein n=1 Tax=Mesorhizobium sp. M0018 TaxID=2956844 RepID=UPI003336CC7F
MTIKGVFEVIGGMTPSLVAGYVADWQKLFSKTLITRPGAPPEIERTGIAVGCFLAVVCCLLFRSLRPRTQITTAIIFLMFSVLLGFFCLWLRHKYEFPMPKKPQEAMRAAWDLSSWVFIVAVVQTILFGTLYALSTWGRPKP